MITFRTRADLRATGYKARTITAAVRSGALIRGRRDHYLDSGTHDEIVRAVRVGGRLTCLSLLKMLGVFVLVCDTLHVHVPTQATRLRSPHDRRTRLQPRKRVGVTLHWTPLHEPVHQNTCVGIIDTFVHALRCQAPRAAVASLDSALRLGVLSMQQLGELFDVLPAKYRMLRGLVDPRSESGPESFVRLMLRGLGVEFRAQVDFDGVGRVDFLVEGWLVIECDSEEFHGTWGERERDLRRDALLAARGYRTLRLSARVIMYEPEVALAAIRGLVGTR